MKTNQHQNKQQYTFKALALSIIILATSALGSPAALAQAVPDEDDLTIVYRPEGDGTLTLVPGGIRIDNGGRGDKLKIVNTSGTSQPPLFIQSTSDSNSGLDYLFVKGVDVTTITLQANLRRGIMARCNVSTITLQDGLFGSLQIWGDPDSPGSAPAVDLVANGSAFDLPLNLGINPGRPVMIHTRQPFNRVHMPNSGGVFLFATHMGDGDNWDIGSPSNRADIHVGEIYSMLLFRDAWINLRADRATCVRGFDSLDINAQVPEGFFILYGRDSLTADVIAMGAQPDAPAGSLFLPFPGYASDFTIKHLISGGPLDIVADLKNGLQKVRARGASNIDIIAGGDIRLARLYDDAFILLLTTGDLRDVICAGQLEIRGGVANAGRIQGNDGLEMHFAAGWQLSGDTPLPDYTGSVRLIKSNVLTSGTLHVSPTGVPTIKSPDDNLTIVTSP